MLPRKFLLAVFFSLHFPKELLNCLQDPAAYGTAFIRAVEVINRSTSGINIGNLETYGDRQARMEQAPKFTRDDCLDRNAVYPCYDISFFNEIPDFMVGRENAFCRALYDPFLPIATDNTRSSCVGLGLSFR
jgi:hypothetical protein